MILCIELISLHVWMFIPCVNDHCGHYLQWLFIFGQAMLYCFIPFCLITLCLLHIHFKLSAYNDRIVLLFLGNTCSYGSRASQILELDMSEFCLTIPNSHVNLEFVLGFSWLYSVPNLLVIQHLETLYLGGNHVRVGCEKVWRKAQEYAFKKSLATGSRDWRVAKGGTHVKHARELKGYASCSTTRQNFQFGQAVISQI